MPKVPLSKVIEHIAREQNAKLMASAKKRYDRYMRLSRMTNDPELKKHREDTAKQAMLMAEEGAKRLNATATKAIRAFKAFRN
jgi:hypothetical protein